MNTLYIIFVLFQIAFACAAILPHNVDYNQRGIITTEPKCKLFTRSNPTNGIELKVDDLKSVDKNFAKPTKFIIHGYMDNTEKSWVKKLTAELLKREDCNVIPVNWSGALSDWLYPEAAKHVANVGQIVSELILAIFETFQTPLNKFHCIGHSLGAHVCGFVGKNVQWSSNGKKIWRITGVDPAGPMFENVSPNETLYKDDAEVTDCMHTDGKKYGTMQTLCHLDSFANKGFAPQPGCWVFSTDLGYEAGDFVACSHLKAHDFIVETVNSNGFVGSECGSADLYKQGKCSKNPTQVLGIINNEPKSGVYYFTTNKKEPFGRNGEI